MVVTSPRAARRRPDAVLWAVSAALALAAVITAALLRPAVSDASAPAPRIAISDAAVSIAAGPSPADTGGLDARVAGFLSRAAAFRQVEPLLTKAFGPAPIPRLHGAPRRPAPAPSRVARGAGPQACLAQAVYYEARGEPAEGQAAVAQVVLNRTRSGRHPSDVCSVVFEGAARPGCQFSFACDSRLGGRRPEAGAWRRAQAVASDALSGSGAVRPELAGVLNYHADYVRPRWAAQLERAAAIGRHIFYAAAAPAVRAATGWTFQPPPAPLSTAGA